MLRFRSPSRSNLIALTVTAALAVPAVLASTSVAAGAGPAVPASGHRVLLGLMDDALLANQPDRAFAAVENLQPRLIRFDVDWPSVARRRPKSATNPNDKAYSFGRIDAIVTRADKLGIPVLLTIAHTPPWAGGGPRHNHVPRHLTDLRNFARAVATRYDGSFTDPAGDTLPRVTRYEAWNEPNTQTHLAPQWVRRNGRWTAVSPRLYAGLLNAIYDGVHAAARSAGIRVQVAGGATKPTGNGPTSSEPSVAPLTFLKLMGHPRLDVYSHHPYRTSRTGTPTTNGNVGMDNLSVLMRQLDRSYPGRHLHLWITEYGVQTNPPDHYIGVSPAKQAALLRQAVASARANPRIDLLTWFLIDDEAIDGRPFAGGFQTGLGYVNGAHKPAWAAFRALASQ